ncbi:RDD family protein, partial [Campylobacter concisus]
IIYWESLSTSTNYDDARNLVLNLFWQINLLKVIYHTFFVWYYGASPGQMITKTMCINVEILDKPNLAQSLVRAIFRIVSEACFYLGFAWALSNPARQTWQDKIAKTVVINA